MIDPNLDLNTSPSREDWKNPPIATLKNWVLGFGGAVLLILVVLYGFYLWQRPKPAQPVDDVKPAIAVSAAPAVIVLPTPTKRSAPPKNATVNRANYAINTPAGAKFKAEIVPKTVEPLTPAEQDFKTRLANFESKIP